jgi:hypothetical protein
LVLPLEELLRELMLHMLDLRDPSELGLLGGVWNDQLLSEPFKSAITCNATQQHATVHTLHNLEELSLCLTKHDTMKMK